MKIKTLILSLTFTLPLFAFANLSHASNTSNKYTPCSDTQIDMVKNLLNLTFEEAYFSGIHDYHSCVVINADKQTLLMVNSNKIAIDKDENGEESSSTYDLTAYLVDARQQKLLGKKVLSKDIISDALHFDGIELDTTPFSTLPNKNVVGLLQKHSHIGGISHGNDDLQLLKLDGTNIRPIGIIMVNEYVGTNWDDDCGSKGNHDNHVKNTLILSKTTHNGLQDINVKSHKVNEGVAGKSCKPFKHTWQKQQTVKFDGNQYNFSHVALENDGV